MAMAPGRRFAAILGVRMMGAAARHHRGGILGGRPELRTVCISESMRVNPMSCCANEDLPPPRQINVEYEEDPENNEFFIQLANGIEDADPTLRILDNPDDIEPRSGSFEVTSGQHLLFSKLQAKRLPTVEEIMLALEEVPALASSCALGKSDETAAAA